MAKGLVYGLVGVLFIQVALQHGSGGEEEANQAGAVETVAGTSYGAVLLTVLAVGILFYVAWRLFTVVLPGDWTGKALLKRIGYAVSALVYVSLLVSTVEILLNRNQDPSSTEDRRVDGVVTDVLDLPAGRVLIIIAGLAVMVMGAAFIHTGVTGGYRESMSAGDSGIEGMAIDRLGMIGWVARGLAFFPVGFLLIRAAWTYNPDEAAGFDDSVREVASHPGGAVAATLVGLGFIAYGLFAGLSARYQRLEGPRNHG
ncbi:MAG: DUF1206 domain-containing protein [Acidimicrobiales bacterium]